MNKKWMTILLVCFVVCGTQAQKANFPGSWKNSERWLTRSGLYRYPLIFWKTAINFGILTGRVTVCNIILWTLPGGPKIFFSRICI